MPSLNDYLILSAVLFTIGTAPENWPPWPWLESGYNVEIEMQDSGDETRGGDALWLVMRDVERHDALAIVYQYDTTRLRDDGVGLSDDATLLLLEYRGHPDPGRDGSDRWVPGS